MTLLVATAAFAASFSGLCALALSMDRHFAWTFGRGRSPGRWRPGLWLAGTGLLACALASCLEAAGPATGWMLWFGLLTAAGLAVIACQAYAPTQTYRVGLTAFVLALAALALRILLR